MAKNPDKTKAFLSALKKGCEFAIDNPDDAAQIFLKAAAKPRCSTLFPG